MTVLKDSNLHSSVYNVVNLPNVIFLIAVFLIEYFLMLFCL